MNDTLRALPLGRRGWRKVVGSCLLALCPMLAACDKKSPADPHIEDGYGLLSTNPQAAYETLGKARNPSDPRVLLGQGLALEKLQKYEDAERVLLQVRDKGSQPLANVALARTMIMLGKADQTWPMIEQAVAAVPADLASVLLETCLVSDEKKAKKTLSDLDRWKQTGPASIPKDFHLAQKVLYAQLNNRAGFEIATKAAQGAKLADRRGAFSLVQLAVKAGKRDFALELLRAINDEDLLGEFKQKVAMLAHGLGDHLLVAEILPTLPGNDAELLALRAEHKFVTEQGQADLALHRALEKAKDPASKERLWLMLGEALLRAGKSGEARDEVEKMLKAYPSESGELLLSRIELAAGQPESALKHLSPLLEKERASFAALELGAQAYIELRRPDEARPLLDAILKERPNHLRAAQLVVSLEMKQGNPKAVVGLVEALVERVPEDVGLRLLLAESTRQTNGDAAASDSLKKSVGVVPGDARLWMALVQSLERSAGEEETLAALEEGHKALPREAILTASLAAQLGKAGQAERAAQLYEGLLSEAKDNPVALNNLAMLYVDDLGNVGRGVELAEQAHHLSQVPGIVDTLGWALFKRRGAGDLKRARELLMSVRGQLTSPTSKYHLGAVLIASGASAEGKGLVRQALAQSGEFSEAEAARTLLASDP